jgi:hypothetical protein
LGAQGRKASLRTQNSEPFPEIAEEPYFVRPEL